MTIPQSRRTVMAVLGAAGTVSVLLLMAGCTDKSSQGVPPPTAQQLNAQIQNNPHIPAQAKAAAMQAGPPRH